MTKTSISVRVDPELGDQLSTVAARLDRPKSWVIEHALKEFIELQLWQFAAIEEGLRDADAGRVVPESVLGAFDIFSLASETEQMQNALPEAMAASRAVAG